MRGEIYYLIKIVIKTAPPTVVAKFIPGGGLGGPWGPMGNPWGPMGPMGNPWGPMGPMGPPMGPPVGGVLL